MSKPYTVPFLGHIPWLLSQPNSCLLGVMKKLFAIDSNLANLQLGRTSWVISKDPGFMLDILTKHKKSFPKGSTLNEVRAISLGRSGINEADGEKWLKFRRILQKGFDDALRNPIEKSIQELAHHTVSQLADDSELDAFDLGSRFAMASICQILFGYKGNLVDLNSPLPDLITEQDYLTKQLMLRYKRTPLWKYLPIPSNFRVKRFAQNQISFLKNIIDQSDEHSVPMLASLKKSYQQGDIDDTEMQILMSNLLGAGTETTATSLQWILYFLSQHPSWQSRLEDLDAIIDEALRLRPPIPMILRESAINQTVKGVFLKKGDYAACLIHEMHTNRDIWGDDAREFNPARFDGERYSKQILRENFFPFGAGPRQCVGARFAKAELKIFLSTLLQKFAVRFDSGIHPKPVLEFSWKPSHNLKFSLTQKIHTV